MSSGRIPSVEGGIQPTIVDAKGDLIVATAADTVSRLAVGSNDQVLTADSSTSTGLKWATPSTGGLTLISEQTASAVTSLSFSSIPSTYKALIFTWHGIRHSTSGTQFGIRFNNDSSLNYEVTGLQIQDYVVNTTEIEYTHCGGQTAFGFGENIQSSTNLSRAAKGTIWLYDYASTTKLKYGRMEFNYFDTAQGTNGMNADFTYDSTSAISSIDIVRIAGTANFSNITNTSIKLYGLS